MSKNEELSKDVDPNYNSDERAGDQAKTVENGMNGRDPSSEKEEGSTKPDNENLVSEGTATSSEVVSLSDETNELNESDKNKVDAPAQDQDHTTPSDVEASTEENKEEIQVQQDQIHQEPDKSKEPDESIDLPGDKKVEDVAGKELESTQVDSKMSTDATTVTSKQPPEIEEAQSVSGGEEKPPEQEQAQEQAQVPEQATAPEQTQAQAPEQEKPKKPWDGVDFTTLDKPGLVKLIELLAKEEDPIMADKVSRQIKECYDVIHTAERKDALDRFVADGNDPDHFAYKFDELDNRFDGSFKLMRDKKFKFIKNLERNKEKNLAEKVSLLEELRALVDEEETTSSIQSVKKIQEHWRELGPVPGQHVKTLWANYHALMDLYYDQRSIYFELKELDRKKNLEAKFELCEKAEKLVSVKNLREAISELNNLHEDFKHIGPVPKADQQALWDRFKHASDQVYARRKEFIKHLKEDLKENLNNKVELAEEVQQYLQFSSDRINDWNKKTKVVLELQKRWESIGGLPRERAKDVNRKFWGAFKGFFHNKGLFFKKLEGERVINLEKKKRLVEMAESLKGSTDWNETAEQLKNLQKEWQNIGPVSEKYRNSIYSQFKDACDSFFNNRRSQNQELEKLYIVNLQKKQQICTEIEIMTTTGDHDLDKFLDLKQKFNDVGYVPTAEVKNIRAQYSEVANGFLATVPEKLADEARQIKYDIQFEKLKKGPHADRRKEQKEQALRKDIDTLGNDISTWRNNLEFFANSKTANKVKEEFTVKIDKAEQELQELKSQLRSLRQL